MAFLLCLPSAASGRRPVREVDLPSARRADRIIFVRDTGAGVDLLDVASVFELGENTAHLAPGHVDVIDDVVDWVMNKIDSTTNHALAIAERSSPGTARGRPHSRGGRPPAKCVRPTPPALMLALTDVPRGLGCIPPSSRAMWASYGISSPALGVGTSSLSW